LVIAVFVENIRRVGSRYRFFVDEEGARVLYAKPYYTLENGALELHGVPPAKAPLDPEALPQDDKRFIAAGARFPLLKNALERLRKSPHFERVVIESGLKDRALKILRYQPIKEYDDPQNQAWLVMRALIHKWIKEHKKPVMLMPIPLRHHVDGLSDATVYQSRLRTATQEAGGTYFDPLETFQAYPAEQRKTLYYLNDGHLTKAGHEALAASMAPAVANLLPSLSTKAS
jgi:hypothetical protein